MGHALEEDPFLVGLRQRNQKQSGYSVLEVGCGPGAFTKQASCCGRQGLPAVAQQAAA